MKLQLNRNRKQIIRQSNSPFWVRSSFDLQVDSNYRRQVAKKLGDKMGKTVNVAFDEFLRDTVNLDPDKTKTARNSRNNLMNNINDFNSDDDFFNIYSEKNLKFGSFARKTKIRPIDDIDLMMCISADGSRKYTESYSCIYITGNEFDKDNNLLSSDTNNLNSTKVINRFISKLSDLNDYSNAEMHKNYEAATLKLKSYTWNFDIVPCFYTTGDFYLIPDGKGNWKKTDPRIDQQRISDINQKHKGIVLNVIRLIKYWNTRKVTLKIPSYLLETMILNYYNGLFEKDNYWVDIEFKDTMKYLSNDIYNDINDPKNIQGNINSFDNFDRAKIATAISNCYDKACDAISFETQGEIEKSINKWREVFGNDFPEYENQI